VFDQFKAMGALAGLMKDKERLKRIGEEFGERLERIEVEGEAGGGAVRVSVSGKMRITDVFLDPALIAGLSVEGGGREMAQALVLEATNDGLAKAQAMVQEEARRQAQELGLPDVPGLDRMLG